MDVSAASLWSIQWGYLSILRALSVKSATSASQAEQARRQRQEVRHTWVPPQSMRVGSGLTTATHGMAAKEQASLRLQIALTLDDHDFPPSQSRNWERPEVRESARRWVGAGLLWQEQALGLRLQSGPPNESRELGVAALGRCCFAMAARFCGCLNTRNPFKTVGRATRCTTQGQVTFGVWRGVIDAQS